MRRRRAGGNELLRDRRLWIGFGLLAVIALTVPVLTAGNTVASSKVHSSTHTVTATQLAPAACKSKGLTEVVVGSPNASAGAANTLMLGTAGGNTLTGGSGNDCILGGAGNDTINGGGGTDYCDGGAGIDAALGCEQLAGIP